jgi:hypothetical protein
MRQLLGLLAITLMVGSSQASAQDVPAQVIGARPMAKAELVSTTRSDGEGWTRYADPGHSFTVELPFGSFQTSQKEKNSISLRSPLGAEIDVYASEKLDGFNPRQFVAAIEKADRIRKVTYRAGGKNWFVRSGFYARTDQGDAVIFYTKFLFSADHRRLAAFEISFPAREKPQFASVVERIEDTFSGPSS